MRITVDRTERFYKIDQLLQSRPLNAPIVWDRAAGAYRFEEGAAKGPKYELPGALVQPARGPGAAHARAPGREPRARAPRAAREAAESPARSAAIGGRLVRRGGAQENPGDPLRSAPPRASKWLTRMKDEVTEREVSP